ncbi:Eco57I restriction-modification methylase domain-containing protein [Salinigranum halophilum]|uniref:Eco57I restriction-modification methylase domain-containing protein n=1 Tax=Salinigranum halophilum TaxID=2565931 RepID=UPI00115D540F|nr:DNA methyltransferase [Salinigranum halophilum]
MSQQSHPYRTNRDLFSNHYLTEHLRQTEPWKEVDEAEVREAYDEIRDLWTDKQDRVADYNEAQLERNFIRPVFDILGIPFEIEETVMRTARRPDYGFFPSTEAADAAFDRADFYEEAIAVADAKYWGRELDTRGEKKRDYENPSYQIHDYLMETPPQWGVLTNGKQWRLYYGPTSHRLDSYYEIDLPELFEVVEGEGGIEDFKDFYLFFRQQAFLPDRSGDCFLDDVYDESGKFAEAIGEDLQENIYDAIRVLAEGFLDTNENLSEDDLPLIHDSSLIYLYRLIFVLYAESEGRDLLPTDNDIYNESYSLNELKREVVDKRDETQQHYQTWQTNLWDTLEELFLLIDQGSQGQGIPKDQLYIPAYNGGLFRTSPDQDDSEEAQFLATHKADDAHVAEVIDLLTRRDADEGDGLVFVDYSSLDERHLGSIYEGLLEYKLDIADQPLTVKEGEYSPATSSDVIEVHEGDVYLRTDAGERKATGSYYTPEYIVEYIVEETLDPIVSDIREDLLAQDPFDKEGGGQFAKDFAERVFNLKILDPAMGSGHFLVNAVDYLAREIIDAQERQDKQAIESGRIDSIEEPTTKEGELRDINWARRQIAQRCIYGIDLNPLATELAKVSLWLRTLAAEQPLAFLDHHLKTGNSLIGANIEDIDELDTGFEDAGPNSQLSEFGVTQKDSIEKLLDIHQNIVSSDNETLEDIKYIEEKYGEFERDIFRNRLNSIANVYILDQYGEHVPDNAYSALARAIDDTEEWEDVSSSDWFERAQTLASTLKPIHYRLEFPDVFYSQHSGDTDPGFDAIIGNPPYVGEKNQKETFETLKKVSLVKNCYHGRMDMLYFFVQLGAKLLNQSGASAMITTAYWPEADSAQELRANLLEDAWIENIIHFSDYTIFDDAKGQQNQIHKISKSEPDEVTIAYLKDSSVTRKELSDSLNGSLDLFYSTQYTDGGFSLPEDGSPWTGLKELARGPIHIPSANETIGEFLTSKQGIVPNPDTVTSRSYDKFDNEELEVGEGVYLLTTSDLDRIGITANHPLLRPAYRNSDIFEFWIDYSEELYLLYITSEDRIDDYPSIREHLERYKTKLESRREVQQGKIEWYSLHWPRDESVFTTPKIVYSNWGNDWQPYAIEENGYYERRDITILKPKTDDIRLQSGVALLNSSLSKYLQTESSTRTGYSTQRSVEDIPATKSLFQSEQLEQIARDTKSLVSDRWDEIEGFLQWIQTDWGVDLEELARKTYVKEYWKHEFSSDKGILSVAKHNSSMISPDPEARTFQTKLKSEYENSVSAIEDIDLNIAQNKAQIDKLVFDTLEISDDDVQRIYSQMDAQTISEQYMMLKD